KYFFGTKIPENIIVQPNKLDTKFFQGERPLSKPPASIETLRFSFLGAFSSPNTIFRFARGLGQKYQKHPFVSHGDSQLSKEAEQLSQLFSNVHFLGAFKNPNDLPLIYDGIDVVVSCYDIVDFNERILEPNKLYEALYFQKPIIVSDGTFLSEK